MDFEIKLLTTTDHDYQKELLLRDEVLRKPIGLCIFDEPLFEENDFHVAAYDGGELVGCLMLSPADGKLKMRQVAVLPSYQKRGIGKALVAFSEALALREGYKEIYMHARISAAPFYEKLNYKTSGAQFLEVGISHVKMYKFI